MPVRNNDRPQRERRRPKHLDDYASIMNDYSNVDKVYMAHVVPTTYKSATESPDSLQWQHAMDNEMETLRETNTFVVTEVPQHARVIGGRWVYAIKESPSGEKVHKARYVAKGCSQIQGIDYTETFSPTARLESVRMLIAVSVQSDFLVHQLDVRSAYLHAPIECDVYVAQPEGYVEYSKNGTKLAWKLLRSLYGLKQSGRNWHGLLRDFLLQNHFVSSVVDPCVYIKKNNDGTTILLVWVDDMILAASSTVLINEMTEVLKNRFKMKDLGEISHFLGIEFSRRNDGIFMTQTLYLKNILDRFDMASCKSRATPCEMKPASFDNQDDTVDVHNYREMVGSLVYAMVCTRPDISFIVTKLSQHLANPTTGDLVMAKHVFRYLKGTLDYGLFFHKNDHVQLFAYCDADWGSNVEDRRSITGYCFSLSDDGPLISWKSKKQASVALSTCEAEYMSISATCQEALYLKSLYHDLTGIVTRPLLISNDNQSAIAIVKNPGKHNRTKHIDIRHHFVREHYQSGDIALDHVESELNVADIFTKPASKPKLLGFHKQVFGQ